MHWASEILAKLRSSTFGKESVVDELQEAIQGTSSLSNTHSSS